MADKKYGIGIIGFGGQGNCHRWWIAQRDDAEIIGIYDIAEARVEYAKENGIRTYASREELLNDDRIDIVVVATPNDVHKEIAIDAMAHGKHVVCEKPVAMNYAELEEMIVASEKYGKLFTVGQNRRWDPDYLTMKKIFDDNLLGKVFQIESRVHGSRGIPGDWRNKKAHGGGMVFDWGIHLVDQMLMMMGDRKLVSVYNRLTNVSNEEVDDGFKLLAVFDDGTEWHVEVGTNNFIELPRWYMLAENGSASTGWKLDGKMVMVEDWADKDAVPVIAGVGLTKTMAPRDKDSIKEFPLPEVHSDIKEFYTNVFAAIEGKEEQLITHDQLRRSFKLMEAMFESHNTNSVIKTEI